MKKLILALFLATILLSCSNHKKQEQVIENTPKPEQIAKTVIGAKQITNEIPGAAYREKATAYFAIVNKDTSSFQPIFSKLKDKEKVTIHQNLHYNYISKTYSERLNELALIMPEAAKTYNLDALTSMSFGWLILSGDLALTLTKEYKTNFGDNENMSPANYDKIENFLLESSLTKDLNKLLKPYSKSVSNIVIEKAFYADKKELLKYSNIATDTTKIPSKVLDFMLWVEFKNE